MITLEDLKDLSEDQIKEHIARNYGKEYELDSDIDEMLKDHEIVFAYESVGSWGCDSSSYFVLRNKSTDKYYDFSGSHCSCYGFEGQFDLSETTIEALKLSAEKGYLFSLGGYDSGGYNDEQNPNMITAIEFVKSL